MVETAIIIKHRNNSPPQRDTPVHTVHTIQDITLNEHSSFRTTRVSTPDDDHVGWNVVENFLKSLKF
jgi:hypothetical protein